MVKFDNYNFHLTELSNYIKFQNYQRERLSDKRFEERIFMASGVPYKFSTKQEIEPFLTMMSNPETVLNGIDGLYNFCSDTKVVLSHQQAAVFLNVIQNFANNQDVIERTLKLIERILEFGEPFNSEVFSTEPFLYIFFTLRKLHFSLTSLYHIVRSSSHCAHLVLEKLTNGQYVSVESLLQVDSYNLEYNIIFLSSFALYDEPVFFDFISSFLLTIFNLSQLGLRPSVRNACLIFLMNSLSKNKSLLELIAYHQYFSTPFQTPPKDRDERILELKILNMVSYQTHNAVRVIVNNDLLPFISSCMKIRQSDISNQKAEAGNTDNNNNGIDYDVSCFAIDVMKQIASCGKEATQILYQSGIVENIFSFLNDQSQFNAFNSSLMALLEIIKYSTTEQKNLLVKNGLFEYLGEAFGAIPDDLLEEATKNIKEILDIADAERNVCVLESLFGAQSLMEELQNMSANVETESGLVAQEILSKAKALISPAP
ncbi:hypothetical protein M9Y10_021952 [Tritrichomonas musculus]|uniref:Uncharacterized protein n=1 Tax=Tritrichomonas musculus TaxID=1915356 RepID=A0ABR2KQX8_9EUKA